MHMRIKNKQNKSIYLSTNVFSEKELIEETLQIELEFGNQLVFEEKGKPEYPEKNL